MKKTIFVTLVEKEVPVVSDADWKLFNEAAWFDREYDTRT